MELPTKNFYFEVENKVKHGATIMEAVVDYCERNSCEIELGAELIASNTILLARLQMESENLHLLKKSANSSLPF